ncbi:unnamed protein product [Amoebophrya sp. A120]|nr:unnamed protein product [Amoebophrya sp. A120]
MSVVRFDFARCHRTRGTSVGFARAWFSSVKNFCLWNASPLSWFFVSFFASNSRISIGHCVCSFQNCNSDFSCSLIAFVHTTTS